MPNGDSQVGLIGTLAYAIAFAVAFNLPYFALAETFDYPQILRRPAQEVLATFAEAGAPLIGAWYAFAITSCVTW